MSLNSGGWAIDCRHIGQIGGQNKHARMICSRSWSKANSILSHFVCFVFSLKKKIGKRNSLLHLLLFITRKYTIINTNLKLINAREICCLTEILLSLMYSRMVLMVVYWRYRMPFDANVWVSTLGRTAYAADRVVQYK